jgi:hypothetical protein
MGSGPTRVDVGENQSDHRYELYVDDVLAAITGYEVRADTTTLEYTRVSDGFARRGLSSRSVAHVLGEARERGFAVLSSCFFAAAYIAKHPDEYLDLVPESRRSEFSL